MMDPDSLRRELAKHILVGVDGTGGRELGNGAYGYVNTVRYKGKEYACKSFHPVLIAATTIESEVNKVKRAFVEECRNAVSMNHSNIVDTFGLFFPQDASFPSIVMELLPYCLGKISDIPSCLKPFILADVAKGLHYLHSQNIMHRDLTAYNILLTTYFTAKISDFGQAKVISPSQIHQHSVAPGNVVYMPPEASITDSQASYDYSLDVFSFGVLILHTYLERLPTTGEMLIPSEKDPKLYTRVPPLDYFKKDIELAVPRKHVLRNLLFRCLEEEPGRRPSSEELDTEMSELIKESHSVMNALKHWCVELKYGNLKQEESIDTEKLEKERQKFEKERVEFEKERMNFITLLQEKEENMAMLQEKIRGFESRLIDRTSERHQDDDDQLEELMQSMIEPEKMEATIADKKKKELKEIRKENTELRRKYEELQKENEQLKRDKIALEERLENGQKQDSIDAGSLTMSLVGVRDWPPTLQTYEEEGQRELTNEMALLTVQEVTQERSSLPHIKGAQAVFIKGKVYIGRATASVWYYDRLSEIWIKLDQDAPVKNYALACYQEQLVLVGGSDLEGKISSQVLVWNEGNNEWDSKMIPTMSHSRENPAAIGYGMHLVAMGGTSTSLQGLFVTTLKNIEIYDNDSWLQAASLPRPGYMVQCIQEDGYLYILNSDGWTIRFCHLASLISTAKNKSKIKNLWKEIQRDVPHTRSCVSVFGNNLLAVAGAGSDGSIYAYEPSKKNPSQGHWKKVACNGFLPAIKNAYCLPVGKREMFLCGGDIDMFTEAPRTSFTLVIGVRSSSMEEDVPGTEHTTTDNNETDEVDGGP